MIIDENLKTWANERDLEKIAAIEKTGSCGKAAILMGIGKSSVSNSIRRLKARAAKSGYAPECNLNSPVPEGYKIQGTSTLYDDAGNVKLQWVKTNEDREAFLEASKIAVEALCEEVKGKSPKVKIPFQHQNDKLLTLYPLGDAHVGMFASKEESGEDYNCQIAADTITSGFNSLVASAPNSKYCLIANVGDWLHTDNSTNQTRRSGNILDVDGRWSSIFKTGVLILRSCINKALEKHEYVKVVNAIGNHDDDSAYALSLVLSAYFDNNPRVEIEDTHKIHKYHKFGNTLFGITHHGSRKIDDLPMVMATDQPKEWGDTLYRHWITGHIHHKTVQEYRGCVVESFRSISPNDAWSTGAGFRSGRDMQLVVFHSEYGETARYRFDINQNR